MPDQPRPIWLDEDWFDTIAEALIRTGRPGLAEKFRDKWRAAPADSTEAARTDVDEWWHKADAGTKDVEPLDEIVEVVLRALGMPDA